MMRKKTFIICSIYYYNTIIHHNNTALCKGISNAANIESKNNYAATFSNFSKKIHLNKCSKCLV